MTKNTTPDSPKPKRTTRKPAAAKASSSKKTDAKDTEVKDDQQVTEVKDVGSATVDTSVKENTDNTGGDTGPVEDEDSSANTEVSSEENTGSEEQGEENGEAEAQSETGSDSVSDTVTANQLIGENSEANQTGDANSEESDAGLGDGETSETVDTGATEGSAPVNSEAEQSVAESAPLQSEATVNESTDVPMLNPEEESPFWNTYNRFKDVVLAETNDVAPATKLQTQLYRAFGNLTVGDNYDHVKLMEMYLDDLANSPETLTGSRQFVGIAEMTIDPAKARKYSILLEILTQIADSSDRHAAVNDINFEYIAGLYDDVDELISVIRRACGH